MSDPFKEMFDRIGIEAIAVRVLELSMIAQAAKTPMSQAEREEWQALIAERRDHVAEKIDETISAMGLSTVETLASLRAERVRRARK